MRALQILIDGFAISALYGLGAVGFTLLFGVSGVLNLAHGGVMVVAALIGWFAGVRSGAGPYGGALIGIVAGLVAAYVDLFRGRTADPTVTSDPARGNGDLHPHRHAALGHHDSGGHELPFHR